MRIAYPIQDLIQKAGNGAKYPLRILLLFAVQWMICSMIFNGRPFLFDPPQTICTDKANTTFAFACTIEQACSGNYTYTYNESSIHSLVYSFDLLCDYDYWSELSSSAMFLGGFLGSYYYAEMQEKNGRLVSITQSLWVTCISILVSVVSPNIYLNILALMAVSFGMFAYLNNSIIYFIEISSDNLRILGPNFFLLCWAGGEMVLSILHVFIQSWRLITLIIMGIPLILSVILGNFMTDSPRFLVSQEKFDQAREALSYIAKYNERELPEYRFQNEDKGFGGLSSTFLSKKSVEKTPTRNFMTLFKYDSLKATSWALLFVRVALSIANQGSLLSINSFHGHTNATVFTSGLVQLFGYLVAAFTNLTFRRKPALKATYIIIGVIYLCFYLLGIRVHEIDIDEAHGFIIFLLIVGRIAVCVGYSTMLIYITEVMPTTLRHHAHGLFACAAYFSMIFIDNLVNTMRRNEMYPQFWLGLIFIALWQVMTYIPETQGHALYEQIKEEDSSLMNDEMI
jgi:MFS transporter, OCT family, solute carrier family 22 (organic cation transporter), member 4/5